jgi:hypothetical protein
MTGTFIDGDYLRGSAPSLLRVAKNLASPRGVLVGFENEQRKFSGEISSFVLTPVPTTSFFPPPSLGASPFFHNSSPAAWGREKGCSKQLRGLQGAMSSPQPAVLFFFSFLLSSSLAHDVLCSATTNSAGAAMPKCGDRRGPRCQVRYNQVAPSTGCYKVRTTVAAGQPGPSSMQVTSKKKKKNKSKQTTLSWLVTCCVVLCPPQPTWLGPTYSTQYH